MSIPGNANPLLLATAADAAAAADVATKSLRFNSDDSAYLSSTSGFANSDTKTMTFSFWLKRVKSTTVKATQYIYSLGGNGTAFIDNDQPDKVGFNLRGTTGTNFFTYTEAQLRDFSAWYHIVVALDLDNSTTSERFKCYINSVQQTMSNTSFPNNNYHDGETWYIGSYQGVSHYTDFYLADFYHIAGLALDPTSFGAYDSNNVWQAAEYSGTFGTNGFHLDFADGSDLGDDNSGNDNDWTPNNFSNFDGTTATASGALPILNTTDNHGGTVGSGTRTDSNSSSIVLALPLNGTNGGTTFTDQSATIKGSGSAKTITRNGDVDTVTSNSQFYGSSAEFDGNGDFLSFSHTGGLGSGDFTIEYWAYHDSLYNYITHFCNTRGASGFNVGTDASGDFLWYDANGGGSRKIEVIGAISAGRWYHFAYVRSSGVLTGYLDGVSQGTYSTSVDYSDSSFNIGTLNSSSERLTGHMQDVRMYVGAAKYTSNFNPPNRTGGSGCDSLFDVPTNGSQSDTGSGGEVSGNYCVLNPLAKGSNVTLSNGNLDFSCTSTANIALSTIGMSSGKWYAEWTFGSGSNSNVGIATSEVNLGSYLSSDAYGWMYWNATGQKGNNGSVSSYGASYSTGDVIGIAFDADNGTLVFYKNGSSQGTAFTGLTSGPYFFAVGTGSLTGNFNFGQRAFAYSAPSGYKALCTTNLPTPTIADGSDYFDTVLYTGNGATGSRSITGLSFAPDFSWFKGRSYSISHLLYDSVRGAGSTKSLVSNGTNSEGSAGDNATFGYLESFDSSGFSIFGGSDVNNGYINKNSATYASWHWDGGTSTVSNTDGSITSSVRANPSAGFSIVKFTGNSTAGATIGHGLNTAPEFALVKSIDDAYNWCAYVKAANSGNGQNGGFYLNLTDAWFTDSGFWNSTAASSTTLTLGSGFAVNENGDDYIAYCFAPVAGYSAFGSYVGNGSSDGPFVFTGFRVAFLMWKLSSAAGGHWNIEDDGRSPFNPVTVTLRAGTAEADLTTSQGQIVDLLSNGFKVKNTSGQHNTSGETYVYMAFASNPFSSNGGLAR